MPDMTLAAVADRIRSTPHGAVAETEGCLGRIDDTGAEGSRTFLKLYREAALAAAKASDERRRQGLPPRVLEGIPISIKDLFDVAGEPTTAGSTILAHAPPATSDATIVERLKSAGAVIMGKTNMTEFAYSGLGLNPHYGTPANPHDSERIPGGSSSGAGVAAATGFAAASIGTDTGGSVRIPAAFCGIVGFKPTQRRVPLAGAYPLSPSLDSIGPLASSVACCAILDAVMAGNAVEALADVALARLRFAIPHRTFLTENLGSRVATAFEHAVATLSRAGARIDERSFAEFALAAEIGRLGGVAPPEAYAVHRENLATSAARYDPRVRRRLELAGGIPDVNYREAVRLRASAVSQFQTSCLEFDALLCPTVAITAPRFDEVNDADAFAAINNLVLRNTALFNLLDCCALSVPCGLQRELPIGLMIVGRRWTDRRLLAVGQAVEAALAAFASSPGKSSPSSK